MLQGSIDGGKTGVDVVALLCDIASPFAPASTALMTESAALCVQVVLQGREQGRTRQKLLLGLLLSQFAARANKPPPRAGVAMSNHSVVTVGFKNDTESTAQGSGMVPGGWRGECELLVAVFITTQRTTDWLVGTPWCGPDPGVRDILIRQFDTGLNHLIGARKTNDVATRLADSDG